MQRDFKPGSRVSCANGAGIVMIVRHSSNEVLIFFPSIRTGRWIDTEKVITEPTNERTNT